MKISVLKFGSSVLRSEDDFPRAVTEIYRRVRAGRRVVAVVSAVGDTTDRLESLAQRVSWGRDEQWRARFLASGEHSASLGLSLALEAAGVPALHGDACAIGLETRGPALDAQPCALDEARVRGLLAEVPVLVVPGFVGTRRDGRSSLLGRGGSDLTALFLADRLGAAECVLVKDVDGVYPCDPTEDPSAHAFSRLSWSDAARLSTQIVQPKALQFAQERRVAFRVAALSSAAGTRIGDHGPRPPHRPSTTPRPLRVALLGHGSVGREVLSALRRFPERFELAAVLVRDPARHRELEGAPVVTRQEDLATFDFDVGIELLGGLDPAEAVVRSLLASGRHVVTANKRLLAERGDELTALARARGVRLLDSASVGAALPVLECVRRCARIGVRRVEGILNGTSNFVLERIQQGVGFFESLDEARSRGYAEADVSFDLDGSDVLQKLVCIARTAFPGRPIDCAYRFGVDPLGLSAAADRRSNAARAESAPADAGTVRLLGRLELCGDVVSIGVRPERVDTSSQWACVRGAHNAVCIELADGSELWLHGRGAGGVPTAQAVVADLFHLRTSRRAAERRVSSTAALVRAG